MLRRITAKDKRSENVTEWGGEARRPRPGLASSRAAESEGPGARPPGSGALLSQLWLCCHEQTANLLGPVSPLTE